MISTRLKGRIAIVTGSSSGIGYGIVERLAKEGAKVILSSRNEERVQDAAKSLKNKGIEVYSMTCNVSDPKDREKLIKKAKDIGGLDILVNTVGVSPRAAFGGVISCPESAWDKIFDVNVKTSFMLTKDVLPLLRQSKYGRVMYISSVGVAWMKEDVGAYIASKVALNSLAKMGALHLGKDNITVNSVSPGVIPTEFSKILTENSQKFLPEIFLRRFGTPEEVAATIAYLASDDGEYVTGQNIFVSGGTP